MRRAQGELDLESGPLVQFLVTPARRLVIVAHHLVVDGVSWRILLDDLATFRPTVLLSVPRVFEKVFHGARRKAVDAGKGRIFDAAVATAVAWSEAGDRGGPGVGLKLRRALFDALVYRRLRAALGGQVRAAVSGSGM